MTEQLIPDPSSQEWHPAPEPEQYADQLGLIDGEFVVHRTGGQRDLGWSVTQLLETQDAGQTSTQFAVIQKTDEEKGVIQKTLPVEKLLSWQVDEKDKLPEINVAQVRIGKLFAPLVPEKGSFKSQNYDYLFGSEDALQKGQPRSTKDDYEKSKLAERAQVTGESLKDAFPYFMTLKSDPEIAQAVDTYKRAHPGVYKENDLMQALREDSVLRATVGAQLLKHVDNYKYHISYESQKNPNHPGYGDLRLTQKEYVALLMLAMADGTFKKPTEAFAITRSKSGEVMNGRHRQVALDVYSDIRAARS